MTLLSLIFLAILISHNFVKVDFKKNTDNNEVLSEVTHKKTNILPTTMPTNSTQIDNPTQSPTPTVIKQDNNTSNDFVYPNSKIIDDNSFESMDNPESITNWYKEKISSMNMNTKSFVSTNTNGNVLNKLAGAGNGKEIYIEITKNNSENLVKIKISLKYL